ncbi:putative dicer-like protein 1 [Coleophoma cylindrospora]|uniref:Dicer-like protein 1 n=1 Tax=Coleophoma cylindrospora TaxID=1849047 RepID=A0A3D8R732_9HELO|nr:putative dicer-like protein 1 [Coleophoma cylindrospora]
MEAALIDADPPPIFPACYSHISEDTISLLRQMIPPRRTPTTEEESEKLPLNSISQISESTLTDLEELIDLDFSRTGSDEELVLSRKGLPAASSHATTLQLPDGKAEPITDDSPSQVRVTRQVEPLAIQAPKPLDLLSQDTSTHMPSSSGFGSSTSTINDGLASTRASPVSWHYSNASHSDTAQTESPIPHHAQIALQPAFLEEAALSSKLTSHAHAESSEFVHSPSKTATLTTRSTADVIADLERPIRNPTQVTSHQQNTKFDSVTDAVDARQQGRGTVNMGASYSLVREVEDEHTYGSNTESEAEYVMETNRPKKISERRRRQQAIAEAHMQKTTREARNLTSDVKPGAEDQQSTRWLVKHSESKDIISSPRDYQVELFERAKEKNIIAVLDTGSGKTLIAVLLLRHVITEELENRALGKPKRISFFLVDSVALVFQQHAVLCANLDQKMAYFCGDMGCDLWSKQLWEKHFSENMIIVCTAEVLCQCLHHSYITMDNINLLIFDEAHHAKKNHSYARIIKDFYSNMQPDAVRPKIFGMTASPVDARVDVRKAAAELEALLHCEITTAADTSLLQYSVKSHVEQLAKYAPLGPRFETKLFNQMVARFKTSWLFQKPLRYSYEMTSDLGSWCADQVWPFCLSEEDIPKLLSKTERLYHAKRVVEPIEELEARKEQIREAQIIIKSHEFEAPDYDPSRSTSKNLSTKVVLLVQYLKERYERPTDDKCIVFVKQRYTARLLAHLFAQETIGTPHLRVGMLVGTRSPEAGDLNASFRQQVITLINFRQGKVNCLFATSVAEEGLDIPDCNLVIRFDLYTTLIQYIQSRGRARHANSKYIHMCEDQNLVHAEIIKEVRKNEGILKRFCNELPDDRKLTGNDYNMDYFLAKERTHRVYTVPATGAKLTYRMSLMVLAHFVGSLPRSSETENVLPEYVITNRNKQYIGEVVLPESSPIRGAIGRPASTRQVAKCSAAFETCLELLKGKFLDEHLLPIYTKKLPAMRNALLAVDSKQREAYDMRTKPSLWNITGVPKKMYMSVLTLKNPEYLGRLSQPLALLTRTPLPKFPQFPLHFGHGESSPVECKPLSTPLDLDSDEEILHQLNGFTLRFFNDVFSKLYAADPASMPYFLAPIKNDVSVTAESHPIDLVSWDIVKVAAEHEGLPWDEHTPESFFRNKYIVDPWDGSRKFWSVGVTQKYKPLDPVPLNTAPRPGARRNNSNIMEYSCSLWEKARARRTFRGDQFVVEAELIGLRRNLLDEFDVDDDETPKTCFIIVEPMKISPIPTTVVAMAYLFPAIIHRVESYLIALEACSMLNLNVRPDLALEAMTKDSDNTEDHGEQQVNFQRGMGANYERLEFLGDCFLKMATSISLYSMHPDSNEFQFHVDRMLLICNKNLRNNAISLKLYEFIRSQGFNRRSWYPEGLVLQKGKRTAAPKSHRLGDKTIADVCEALIGAALLTQMDTNNMDGAVRAVTELVRSENHNLTSYADYYKQYTKPRYQIAAATAAQKDLARQVEEKHPYHFKYPRLLRSAFIHPSYPFSYENIPSYQRLEFLGDSLLDMACVNFLFHKYPTRDPQWLTEHKMAMVSNRFLGALCVMLGFHKHLLVFNATFQKQIQDYVFEITEARTEAEEKAIADGMTRDKCSPDFWVQTKPPPKCLPDIVEAFIGSLFVDSEYNYHEVERFFNEHIRWYFQDMSIYDSFANKHPTTALASFLDTNMGCSNWRLFSKPIPQIDGSKTQVLACIMIHDQVIADDCGDSARYAKVRASQLAMRILDGLSPTEFRQKYDCDCSTDGAVIVDEEVQHGSAI